LQEVPLAPLPNVGTQIDTKTLHGIWHFLSILFNLLIMMRSLRSHTLQS